MALYCAVMGVIHNNIANILTMSRLFLLPVIVGLFFLESSWGAFAVWLCLLLYILAALTDFFDGYVARKLNQVSGFGTFLDPISDKIFVSSLLILLVAFGRIEGVWVLLVILIFAREFLVSGLREFLGPKNITVPVVQMLSLGFLIIGGHAPYALELGLVLLALATIFTLVTGFSYMVVGLMHMRD